ncbi:protein virilizer homolog isoform X2 [Phoenix dactylifera]|uniref:Protein virilizer homolog isoform X2 n=1 Tax=Phoenix dactylifera TaxID=42345 RepID=A0A8B9A090_PHODC|nr:protein virilizer homolog isoform X2 [Phoenix dactylifera]
MGATIFRQLKKSRMGSFAGSSMGGAMLLFFLIVLLLGDSLQASVDTVLDQGSLSLDVIEQEQMNRSLMVCQDKFEAAKLQQIKTSVMNDLESCINQAIDENIKTLPHIVDRIKVKESLDSLLFLLQSPTGSSSMSEGIVLSEDNEDALSLSNVWKLKEDEKAGNQYLLEGIAEKFVWECPDSSLDRRLVPALSARRKLATVEGSGRRTRDNTGSEAIGSNVLSRGLGVNNVASGPTRRDTFRRRKPNTSRPPSMHVDDYVARERNIDGASSGSNIVSSSLRGTSMSGRPPSIHVDEFMAGQRERQNPMAVAVGDLMRDCHSLNLTIVCRLLSSLGKVLQVQ